MSATTLTQSLAQVWPPFALVAGLVLTGVAADLDGLFEALGSRIARVHHGEVVVFSALMSLVAIVSVTLNLDTAVVFLTPVLLHVARQRSVPETPYLYGAVFMANAGSLLLPGSNLTNLLVLADARRRGTDFASVMLAPWLLAVLVTWVILVVWRRHDWGSGRPSDDPASALKIGFGALGVLAVTALTLGDSRPGLPVLAVGVLVATLAAVRHHVSWRRVKRSLGPGLLASLFAVSVLLGSLARLSSVPAHVLASVGPWGAGPLAAGLANLINNLPAAVILSSHQTSHPFALLLGLDLGPNLTLIGALSGLLWFRIARENDASPSALRFTRIGAIVVPLSLLASLIALRLVTPGSF